MFEIYLNGSCRLYLFGSLISLYVLKVIKIIKSGHDRVFYQTFLTVSTICTVMQFTREATASSVVVSYISNFPNF